MIAREAFLKALAFVLGFKHKSPAERAEGGKRLVLEALRRMLATRLNFDDVQEIQLIGAIPYSDEQLAFIKEQISQGGIPKFSFPTSWDSPDFINFYRIDTSTNTYICAVSDNYDYMRVDQLLMWAKLSDEVRVDHLPIRNKYLYKK